MFEIGTIESEGVVASFNEFANLISFNARVLSFSVVIT